LPDLLDHSIHICHQLGLEITGAWDWKPLPGFELNTRTWLQTHKGIFLECLYNKDGRRVATVSRLAPISKAFSYFYSVSSNHLYYRYSLNTTRYHQPLSFFQAVANM
jgi:hypothetical protein